MIPFCECALGGIWREGEKGKEEDRVEGGEREKEKGERTEEWNVL